VHLPNPDPQRHADALNIADADRHADPIADAYPLGYTFPQHLTNPHALAVQLAEHLQDADRFTLAESLRAVRDAVRVAELLTNALMRQQPVVLGAHELATLWTDVHAAAVLAAVLAQDAQRHPAAHRA
jgi:hypothetical protein